jgi:hypothetical protein
MSRFPSYPTTPSHFVNSPQSSFDPHLDYSPPNSAPFSRSSSSSVMRTPSTAGHTRRLVTPSLDDIDIPSTPSHVHNPRIYDRIMSAHPVSYPSHSPLAQQHLSTSETMSARLVARLTHEDLLLAHNSAYIELCTLLRDRENALSSLQYVKYCTCHHVVELRHLSDKDMF